MVRDLVMMPIKENKELDIIVKSIKKVRNKYSVTFVNKDLEEQVHQFSEDQMVEYRITIDKGYSFQELELIIKSSELTKWYSKSLNYLLIKPRTEKEIWRYLDKSELDFTSKETIVKKLIEYKYINDEHYVKLYIDDAISKCVGKKYVKHTLERLGISPELISNAIETYQEQDLTEKLIAKYQKIELTLISLPIAKQKLKLTQKMALKGISTTIIQEVLSNIEYTEDISKTFEKDYNRIKKQTIEKNKIIQKLLRLGYTNI